MYKILCQHTIKVYSVADLWETDDLKSVQKNYTWLAS